mmetsp:Transcript_19730/g.23677  ORF Transcript_19730/g.23677 Transcript_19730/m.23677 type:complete len:146 (-) Transcript_19730:249-686(-)|eukprot:CAMPEP_0195336576 /NCGR_PEP_ID=MMETSP0708-20121125/16313_1 /TAXON_ID=33640 /ORGANISM="Asterionellopsis glacialis, Strain CCMP134" /LENGTH=145 /DNA_ID=CAMNT_0040407267 /DNA_START=74 /DNA_END=511 /DNA_ORIENTATION=+
MTSVSNVPTEVSRISGDGIQIPKKEGRKSSSKKKEKKEKKDKKEKKIAKGKKSGVRTKFILESLRSRFYELKDENENLRQIVLSRLPDQAGVIFADCCFPREEEGSTEDRLSTMMSNATIEEGDEDVNEDEDEDSGDRNDREYLF